MSGRLSLSIPWPRHIVEKLFYVKGRIGWRGLRHDEFTDDGPYLITGIHIQNGRVDWSSCYHIPKQKYNESPEIMVSPGDIVITKDGTIGKVALIEEVLGLTTINSHLFLVHPLDPTNGINSNFAYHVFSSFLFTDFVNQWMSGSTLSGLGEAKFLRFQFPVPPISEQLKISRILDTLDGAISKTEAVIRKLRQIRAGLLHDLLTRGLDENGELRDPIVHPELFHDSPIGLIPKEWKLIKLNDEFDIEHGYAFDGHLFTDRPIGLHLLVPGNFHRDGGLYFTESNTKYFAGRYPPEAVLKNGDILVVMTDLSPKTLILGRTVLLDLPFPVLHNQRIGRFRLKKSETWNPWYFVALMNDERVRRKVIREATGTTVRHTSPDRIKSGFGLKPPLEEQDRIVLTLQGAESQIRSTECKLLKLQAIKSGLMSDLLTGRVRVPEGII